MTRSRTRAPVPRRPARRLSDADARLALVGPAAQQEVEFLFLPRRRRTSCNRESGGYPYFLQEERRGRRGTRSRPPIDTEHVRAVEEIVEDNLDLGLLLDPRSSSLRTRSSATSWLSRRSATAPTRTAQAASAAGYRNAGGASAVREELIAKELILEPTTGPNRLHGAALRTLSTRRRRRLRLARLPEFRLRRNISLGSG